MSGGGLDRGEFTADGVGELAHQENGANTIVHPAVLLSLVLAQSLLQACGNADNTDHYPGKELVDALVFPSEDHRAQYHCLIASLREQYEASTGATFVNLHDGDTELIVSWCAMNDDPSRFCERGGGLGAADTTGDVGVDVYTFSPNNTGLVSDYRYSSILTENDPDGWQAGISMDWITDRARDVTAFYPGFVRLIDGEIRNLESPSVPLSPRFRFVSSGTSYRTQAHYTLSDLLSAVSDSDDSLRTLLIRYFNAVENDLELQAINDPSIDEATRDNYLNELRGEFDYRRASANAFAGRWRALLAEQLLVVEDCLHLEP